GGAGAASPGARARGGGRARSAHVLSRGRGHRGDRGRSRGVCRFLGGPRLRRDSGGLEATSHAPVPIVAARAHTPLRRAPQPAIVTGLDLDGDLDRVFLAEFAVDV